MRRDVVSDIKCKYVGWKGKTEEAETEENCLLVTTASSLYCPEVINGPSLDLLISSFLIPLLNVLFYFLLIHYILVIYICISIDKVFLG